MNSSDATKTPIRFQRRYAGFSLIELLTSVVLSLVVLGGVLSVFSSTRGTSEKIEELSRLQEAGRFALDEIARDLREAGYSGCAKSPFIRTTNALNDSVSRPWRFSRPVEGFDEKSRAEWKDFAATSGTSIVDGTDVLFVRGPKSTAAAFRLRGSMTDKYAALSIDSPGQTAYSPGDVLMISDCRARTYFQVTGYDAENAIGTIRHDRASATASAPGNASADLGYRFAKGAEVIPVVTRSYFVARNSQGSGLGLWRGVGVEPPELLIGDVEDFQVQFGSDVDGDSNVETYLDATEIRDWSTVVNVRIALLVRAASVSDRTDAEETYSLLDARPKAYSDRRIRRVFSSVVALRNVLP